MPSSDSPALRLAPMTVKAARAYVAEHHRHLGNCHGGLFAVAALAGDEVAGVAIAGHPARVWMGTGRIVITRVATEGAPNACSMLYGAMCRAAKALGWREAWTYTLPHESGASLRAAGFRDMGLTRDEEWHRPSRARAAMPIRAQKRRWMRELAS